MSLQWTQADIDFLATTYSGLFQEARDQGTPVWPSIATRVGSSGSKNMYAWLGEHPEFREFVDERYVHETTGSSYELKNKKYESTIKLDRDDVEDNNLDSYPVRVAAMGEAARQHPDELIFGALENAHAQLCYDDQYFFDTDHPVQGASVANMITVGSNDPWFLLDCRSSLKPLLLQVRSEYEFKIIGDGERAFMRDEVLMGSRGRLVAGFGMWRKAVRSVATLDEAGFKAARLMMRSFKTDKGRPARCRPSHIVVGASNESAAEALFTLDRLANGASNPLKGAVQIIVADWL